MASIEMPQPNSTALRRFWAKVAKSDGCWLWLAGKDRDGYGFFKPAGARVQVYAHRFGYWLANDGNLPREAHVLHRCDTPSCVNPAHLFLGTQSDNNKDMAAKGRARGSSRPGQKNPAAKLDERRVSEIRQRLAAGEGLNRLSREMGFHPRTIADIRDRVLWKHVEEGVDGRLMNL